MPRPKKSPNYIQNITIGTNRKIEKVKNTMAHLPADFDIPKQYVDTNGRIAIWPRRKKRALQLNILRYLLHYFELERIYTEREVNDILKSHHTFEDWAMMRRELFELGWLTREKNGTNYRRLAETVDDMVDRYIGE